jgi:hypothetical protein
MEMVKDQEPGKLTIKEATEQTERCMIHLDDNIYVVAKMYDGALQVHIRQSPNSETNCIQPRKGSF